MRTLGSPWRSTVASAMALGSAGSEVLASSNQAANSLMGSVAFKSLDVNPSECSMGAVSDIRRRTFVDGTIDRGTVRRTYHARHANGAGPRRCRVRLSAA